MFNKNYKVGVIALFLLLSLSSSIFSLKETNVKAYFIYQFTKFIQWPEGVTLDPLVIAVWGGGKITKPLQIIAKEKSDTKQRLVIKTLDSLENFNGVHILFIPKEKSAMLPKIINALGDEPVVIITEKKGMAVNGSAINFVISNEKIGFEVNLKTIKKLKLYISSRLLRLAVKVYGE